MAGMERFGANSEMALHFSANYRYQHFGISKSNADFTFDFSANLVFSSIFTVYLSTARAATKFFP
jgi:hypothetical protein